MGAKIISFNVLAMATFGTLENKSIFNNFCFSLGIRHRTILYCELWTLFEGRKEILIPMFFWSSGRDEQDPVEHALKETRQILFSYLSKYFIETAYVCQRSIQLWLHNFFYGKNWYFCSFYSTFNLKWLCSSEMSSRRLYSRSWRWFLVFMKMVQWFSLSKHRCFWASGHPWTRTTTWKHIFWKQNFNFI